MLSSKFTSNFTQIEKHSEIESSSYTTNPVPVPISDGFQKKEGIIETIMTHETKCCKKWTYINVREDPIPLLTTDDQLFNVRFVNT